MTATYVALKSTTLSVNTQTVTITGIPSTYSDIRVVIVPASSSGTNGIRMRINGNTSSVYTSGYMYGNGSTATANMNSTSSNMTISYAIGISTTLGQQSYIIDFLDYANTTKEKNILFRNNFASGVVETGSGLWAVSNAAISELSFNINTFGSSTGDFIAGSTFTVYGILAEVGESTPKATGGIVTSDATYWYHTFTSVGNFIPNQSLSCDYLVVAGGGSGALGNAGGGGAGGYLTGTGLSVTAQSYAVLIGAGGASAIGGTAVSGYNGSNSIFSSITATGGGGGGAATGTNGLSGGSGGGGGGGNGSSSGGAASPSGQGNAGGGASSGAPFGGGGGGGAGGSGGAGPTNGNGGIGATTVISGGATTGAGQLSGGSYYFAGGGGGGERVEDGGSNNAGGLGGGATGSASNQRFDGTANTGGGGGGNGTLNGSSGSGAGGSGIVIIRYTKA